MKRTTTALLLAVVCAAALLGVRTVAAGASTGSVLHTAVAISDSAAHAARDELTAGKAVVLGLVEGITEFLPISSTGHLLVTQRLLDVGTTSATKDAADTYAIVIQAGAILAVLVLYWRRVLELFAGLRGKSAEGRRILVAILIAFVPSAVVGVVGDKTIKAHLLEPIPVAIAWILGAIAIFAVGSRLHQRGASGGRALGAITTRDAVVVGLAQVLALWPGTSRSLVTILAALIVGLDLAAAVEFSFLLGLLTLSAATAYDLLKHGSELFSTYGVVNPLIGFVVAFVAAVAAVRWMVTYLQRHDLSIFAWYRLIAAAITIVLVVVGTI